MNKPPNYKLMTARAVFEYQMHNNKTMSIWQGKQLAFFASRGVRAWLK